ncbi:MAG: hypothetical protein PVJ53_18050, partial [Desulfobacterales bacterium]
RRMVWPRRPAKPVGRKKIVQRRYGARIDPHGRWQPWRRVRQAFLFWPLPKKGVALRRQGAGSHQTASGVDVRHHAGYLTHQHRRPDAIEAFFKVVYRERVNERFAGAGGHEMGMPRSGIHQRSYPWKIVGKKR